MADTDHCHYEYSTSNDVSYEEDEVFFGAVSEKESRKVKKLSNRKTERYFIDLMENVSISDNVELVESSTGADNLKLSELPILSAEECQSQLFAIVNEADAESFNSQEHPNFQNCESEDSLNPFCASFQENIADSSINFFSDNVINAENSLLQLKKDQNTSHDHDSLVEEKQLVEKGKDMTLPDIIKVSNVLNLESYVDNLSNDKISIANSELNNENETFDFTNPHFSIKSDTFQSFDNVENNLNIDPDAANCYNGEVVKCPKFKSEIFARDSDATSRHRNFENICNVSNLQQNIYPDSDDHIQSVASFERSEKSSDIITESNSNSFKELSDSLNNLSDENYFSNKVLQISAYLEHQSVDANYIQKCHLNSSDLSNDSKLDEYHNKGKYLNHGLKEICIALCDTPNVKGDEKWKECKLSPIKMKSSPLLSVKDDKEEHQPMNHQNENLVQDTSLNLVKKGYLFSDMVNLEIQMTEKNDFLQKNHIKKENFDALPINSNKHLYSNAAIVVNTSKNRTDVDSTVISICKESNGLLKSRESYFSSLDVININNDVMFQSFIIDEKVGLIDKLTKNYGDSKEIKCIDNGVKIICDTTEQSTFFSETQSNCSNSSIVTVEDSTDNGSKNCALYLSDNSKNTSSPQLKSKEPDFTSFCSSQSEKVKVFRDDSVHSLDNPFNDTIEEMELLLKYGDKYFQENETNKKINLNYKETSESDDDESILSPTKKLSVASVKSTCSFVPNLESTRASSDLTSHSKDLEEYCKNQITPISASLLNKPLTDIYSKKEPPPKPPRNIQGYSTVPLCLNKLNNEDVTIKSNCLPNNSLKINCSTPITSKVTSVHAPMSLKSKMTRQISNSTRRLNNHATPINKTSKFKTSTLTPQAKHVPNGKKIFSGASIENFNSCPLTPKNFEGRIKSYSSASRTVKAERVGSKICQKPFLTPQGRAAAFSSKGCLKKQDSSNSYCNLLKVRGLNIVSPVAKYLQDNPPPPLIATVKPKHRPMISPISTPKTPITMNNWSTKTGESTVKIYPAIRNLDASMLQRDETIEKINDNMRKLTLKVNSRIGASSNMLTSKNEDNIISSQVNREFNNMIILPSSVYFPGKVHKLENKENFDQRREIPSDKPPNAILKHKGRIQVPKPSVHQLLRKNDSSAAKLCPEFDSVKDLNSSGRVSFMEVSVNEAASVNHTNTLH